MKTMTARDALPVDVSLACAGGPKDYGEIICAGGPKDYGEIICAGGPKDYGEIIHLGSIGGF
jgi:hypothetical protein